jgi:hypothetical protein
MKLFLICFLAAGALTFLSGCATDDSRAYSEGQIRAQHSSYNPI